MKQKVPVAEKQLLWEKIIAKEYPREAQSIGGKGGRKAERDEKMKKETKKKMSQGWERERGQR